MEINKVYVRFGDISKNDDRIPCFEGIVEGNVVKIIMPTTLYSTCQVIASYIDNSAFIVDGDLVGKGNNGEPLLSNIKIKIPLTFNKDLETYTCDVPIIPKRKKRGNPNLPQWYNNK